MPPMIHAGSPPVSRSTNAIIAAVVVLPCAPPTTIAGCAATSSARNSARGVPSIRCRCAVETTTSQPGRRRGLAADVDLDPLERPHEDRVAQIPAAHLGPERPRDVGVGGHARPADPDEVELAGRASGLYVSVARQGR